MFVRKHVTALKPRTLAGWMVRHQFEEAPQLSTIAITCTRHEGGCFWGFKTQNMQELIETGRGWWVWPCVYFGLLMTLCCWRGEL